MLYGSAVALAIRAALYLALQPPDRPAPIHEIARRLGLPKPYLAKVVQQLTAAGLVAAYRGPGGGLSLARSPRDITLWSIVRAMEGPGKRDVCLLGLQTCTDEHPCPLHDQWSALRARMEKLLEGTTLFALAKTTPADLEERQAAWMHLGQVRTRQRKQPRETHVTRAAVRGGDRGSRRGSSDSRVPRRSRADH